MKKPRAVINIGGEEIVMDNFYRYYENTDRACICTDKEGIVVSIENTSQDQDLHVTGSEKNPYVVLTPGTKASFGSLKFTRDELKLVYRNRPIFNYEDEEDGA